MEASRSHRKHAGEPAFRKYITVRYLQVHSSDTSWRGVIENRSVLPLVHAREWGGRYGESQDDSSKYRVSAAILFFEPPRSIRCSSTRVPAGLPGYCHLRQGVGNLVGFFNPPSPFCGLRPTGGHAKDLDYPEMNRRLVSSRRNLAKESIYSTCRK
jgi:hypothetical protein